MKVLATYDSDEGERQLVGQRINGHVALSDIPTAQQGRVHLIERHLTTLDELDALVADYLTKVAEVRRCPMAPGAWWI